MQREQPPLAESEAAHQRTGIEMALQIAATGHRHRHSSQHHRQQGGQPEKTLRPVERIADFRTRVARIFKALTACQPRRQPVAKGSNVSRGARQQQPIADPRAELQQAGGGEIVGVHHQARREAEEIDTAIRFMRQRCRYGEGLTAELQRFAVLQGAGQSFVDPDFAAGRAMADARRRHADF